jgi:two-component system CheB/CheR fusion protein
MPCIMITGNSDVQMAVDAMKSGAIDFLEKPFNQAELLGAVNHAMVLAHDIDNSIERQAEAKRHIADLTPRQREIMDMVLAGHPSKNIAADLGISQRTVENHRASIMKRTGAKSLPALARLAVVAASLPGKPAA